MTGKDSKESRPRETHGMRTDVDDDTPVSAVKGPNMFERMKEELEAIVETVHPHKETKDPVSPLKKSEKSDEATIAMLKLEKPNSASHEKDAEKHNLIEKAKEGMGAIMEKVKSPHKHHKETHGRSNDFDENTPVSEVKGPSVFQRAKEEVEALVDAFHHKDENDKTKQKKRDDDDDDGCFGVSVGKGLEKKYLLDILDKILSDDLLVVLLVADTCGKSCKNLLTHCVDNIIRSDVDIITLDGTLPEDIVKQIVHSRNTLGLHEPAGTNFPDKHVKRTHRALDSDDVELVRMLLKEAHTNLDDAYALHYAVAYCDPKTTMDLLDLAIADVSHRNSRGITVLHVAATRKEPKIIVSLLTKGAQPTDLTSDGRKALEIAKRLTRAVDYHKSTEEGKASPKDRLCIEILEQAERRDLLLGEASECLAEAGDDLRMRLLYLENRVGLAKLPFPMEAKVAMDIAQVDGTSEFTLASFNIKKMTRVQQKNMDSNDAPFKIKEEHLNRLRALFRTVELGKRFFPRCSKVINKLMDNEYSELAYLENENPEESELKKRRYMELQEVLSKAFHEDKKEFDKSNNISSSSSSTSIAVARRNSKLTLKKQINS